MKKEREEREEEKGEHQEQEGERTKMGGGKRVAAVCPVGVRVWVILLGGSYCYYCYYSYYSYSHDLLTATHPPPSRTADSFPSFSPVTIHPFIDTAQKSEQQTQRLDCWVPFFFPSDLVHTASDPFPLPYLIPPLTC